MGVIAVVMLLIAWILARWQVARLIRPINELDLDNPMENDVYEELTPLLMSIDRQNKEKDAIANMRKEFSANVSHELKLSLIHIFLGPAYHAFGCVYMGDAGAGGRSGQCSASGISKEI